VGKNLLRLTVLAGACLVAGGCAAQQRFVPGLRPAQSALGFEATVGEAATRDLTAAVALVADLRYREAQEKLAPLPRLFEAARDRDRAAQATFWLGYCLEKQGDPAGAARFYTAVTDQYASTPAAQQAAARLSQLVAPPTP
jgi:TolA-binding protein